MRNPGCLGYIGDYTFEMFLVLKAPVFD